MEIKPSRLLASGLRRLAGILDPTPPVSTAAASASASASASAATESAVAADDRPVAPEHWLARLEQAGLSTAAYRTAPEPAGQLDTRAVRTRAGPRYHRIRRMLRLGSGAVQQRSEIAAHTEVPAELPTTAAAAVVAGSATELPSSGQPSTDSPATGQQPVAETVFWHSALEAHGSARNSTTPPAVPAVLRIRPRISAVLPSLETDPSVRVVPVRGAEPAGGGRGVHGHQDYAMPQGTLASTPPAASISAQPDPASVSPRGRLFLNFGRRPQDSPESPSSSSPKPTSNPSSSLSSKQPIAVFRPATGSTENQRTAWSAAGDSGIAGRSVHNGTSAAATPADKLRAATPLLRPPPPPISQGTARRTPTPAPPLSQHAARQSSTISAPPTAAAATIWPAAGASEVPSGVPEIPPWPELPAKNRSMPLANGNQASAQWLDLLARTSRLAAEQGAR